MDKISSSTRTLAQIIIITNRWLSVYDDYDHDNDE